MSTPREPWTERPRPGQPHPLLRDETGTLRRRGQTELLLCYPNSYRVAGASLGLQVLYRLLNARQEVSCQRAVCHDDVASDPDARLLSLEHGMAPDQFDAILFSIAYELDVPHLPLMLARGGVEPLAAARPASAPPVIAGGPLTQSNVLPLAPFVDAVVLGEAEEAIGPLLDALVDRPDRPTLLDRLDGQPGVWLPSRHGDAVPDVLVARGAHIPATGQWRSPHAEFADMALLESSRGCPRYCKFCVVRAPASPMRSPELERVLAALELPLYREAPRIGLVGAAVSDWPPLEDALRAIVERGQGVGVSSLRADRLSESLVGLLAAGGYRTLTVASDAASQRLRGKMMKGLRERHFLAAADLAAGFGLRSLKLYVIVGLPDERDADLVELVDLCQRLRAKIPLTLTLSPFVPKLHTPLAEAPFEAVEAQQVKLERLRRELGKARVEVRFDAPRWAWVEYRLSQGGPAAGLAAWQALQAGGSFRAWQRAFAALDGGDDGAERAAVAAAQRHGLWALAGAR